MLIGKNWKIEADNLNVILFQKKKRVNRNTGEAYEAWQIMGYFATVKNALHELVNQGIRDTALKDLKTIVTGIEELQGLIGKAPVSVLQPNPGGSSE